MWWVLSFIVFGCYNIPEAKYDCVVGKQGFGTTDEDPVEENWNDSSLFCFDLEISFRKQDTTLLKRKKMDCIDRYKYLEQDSFPESNYLQYSRTLIPAEKELMCVKDWNLILHKQNWTKGPTYPLNTPTWRL